MQNQGNLHNGYTHYDNLLKRLEDLPSVKPSRSPIHTLPL